MIRTADPYRDTDVIDERAPRIECVDHHQLEWILDECGDEPLDLVRRNRNTTSVADRKTLCRTNSLPSRSKGGPFEISSSARA